MILRTSDCLLCMILEILAVSSPSCYAASVGSDPRSRCGPVLGVKWLLFVRRSLSKIRVGSPHVTAAKWLPPWIGVYVLAQPSLVPARSQDWRETLATNPRCLQLNESQGFGTAHVSI